MSLKNDFLWIRLFNLIIGTLLCTPILQFLNLLMKVITKDLQADAEFQKKTTLNSPNSTNLSYQLFQLKLASIMTVCQMQESFLLLTRT